MESILCYVHVQDNAHAHDNAQMISQKSIVFKLRSRKNNPKVYHCRTYTNLFKLLLG